MLNSYKKARKSEKKGPALREALLRTARLQALIITSSILNLSFALMEWGRLAGMIIISPSRTVAATPEMVISAAPSTIWTKASKGAVMFTEALPLRKREEGYGADASIYECLADHGTV